MRTAATISAAVAVGGYLVTGPLTADLMAAVGTQCTATAFRTVCAFPPQQGWTAQPYLALAAMATCGIVAARTIWRDASPAMLINVFCGVVLAATIYDSLLRMPAIGEAKLSNDTLDTLRFAVLASLLMTAGISRRAPAPLWASTVATVASYASTMLATLVYASVSSPYIGATRMTMLFLVYTMVGFGLHIMAVGWLTTTMRMTPAKAVKA